MEFLGAIWWIPGWNGRASGSERAVRALVGSPSRAPQGGNYIKAAAKRAPDNRRKWQWDGSGSLAGEGAPRALQMPDLHLVHLGARLAHPEVLLLTFQLRTMDCVFLLSAQ